MFRFPTMSITTYQVQGSNLSSYKKNTPNRDETNLRIINE
ncbi:hypothetical protein SAMN05444362_101310 [Dysgonomonas macrotermitis]|uniref:Uncharacterized protein n=1 Tax=Dysgonomonas macrotermitis TaxID=1346286 RepID=A0A1M4TEH3_9BACT|nr:hypothetical protein SAMN05444362_101310 [Dysgonomonas macrotermitis]